MRREQADEIEVLVARLLIEARLRLTRADQESKPVDDAQAAVNAAVQRLCEERDRLLAKVDLLRGVLQCPHGGCGLQATCVGSYEGNPEEPACDLHCGHGNEEGRCVMLDDDVPALPQPESERWAHHLVDVVWGVAHEDESVPDTLWARRMIERARETFEPGAGAGERG